MCTAININKGLHLFGRTLDFEHSFGQEIVSVPRNYRQWDFSYLYSVIGVGRVVSDLALLFDGMNEAGLCGGALNFPGLAVYQKNKEGRLNLKSFQLLPYILSRCKSTAEARGELEKINVTDEAFSDDLPATLLHWIFADKHSAITVEPLGEGLRIYDNPVGILTNSPSFDYHLLRLSDYMNLSAHYPENALTDCSLPHYSRGMGAIGLPGDFSSSSRFVRAAYLIKNTVFKENEIESLFHILDSVSVPDGCVRTKNGEPVRTYYTVCACSDDLTYRYTTYNNRSIRSVRLDPSDDKIKRYSMNK